MLYFIIVSLINTLKITLLSLYTIFQLITLYPYMLYSYIASYSLSVDI